MYSTLSLQSSLSQIRPTDNSFFVDRKQYLLVRNPYLRIVSFFKDKFRQVVANHKGKKGWQHCQKIFFDDLGLEETLHYKIIKSKLLDTSFDEFITLLPHLYHLDSHLEPQYFIEKTLADTLGTTSLKLERVYKMECPNHLKEMATTFNLDLSIKKNATNKVNSPINWTKGTQKIINEIYANDFKVFDYDFNLNEKIICD